MSPNGDIRAVGSLEVNLPAFGAKALNCIPDATKDPLSASAVSARKIRRSESRLAGLKQFSMGIVSGEISSLLRRQTSAAELEMFGVTIYRQNLKSDSYKSLWASFLRRRPPLL